MGLGLQAAGGEALGVPTGLAVRMHFGPLGSQEAAIHRRCSLKASGLVPWKTQQGR